MKVFLLFIFVNRRSQLCVAPDIKNNCTGLCSSQNQEPRSTKHTGRSTSTSTVCRLCPSPHGQRAWGPRVKLRRTMAVKTGRCKDCESSSFLRAEQMTRCSLSLSGKFTVGWLSRGEVKRAPCGIFCHTHLPAESSFCLN